MKWQPINEAPHNAEVILVWCPDTEEVITAWWSERDGRWLWMLVHDKTGDRVRYTCNPTHWMHLPEPPE